MSNVKSNLERVKKLINEALTTQSLYEITVTLIALDKEVPMPTKFKSGDTVYAREDIQYHFTCGIVPTGTVGVLSDYPMEGYDERVFGGVKWTGIEVSLPICTLLRQLRKRDCEHEEPISIRTTIKEVERDTIQWCPHCGSLRLSGSPGEWAPWMNPRIKHSQE
jgi:hypothetical protein